MTKITSWKTLITWFNDVNNVFDDPNNVVGPAKNPVCFIQNANDKPQPNIRLIFRAGLLNLFPLAHFAGNDFEQRMCVGIFHRPNFAQPFWVALL
jgi:hypothetical protein